MPTENERRRLTVGELQALPPLGPTPQRGKIRLVREGSEKPGREYPTLLHGKRKSPEGGPGPGGRSEENTGVGTCAEVSSGSPSLPPLT